MYKYNLVNNKIDSKKLRLTFTLPEKNYSCNFHLASFYLVNSFFRQSELESRKLTCSYQFRNFANTKITVAKHHGKTYITVFVHHLQRDPQL